MHLDNQLRAHNMKLRGFQEGAEESTELSVFMANWIASALKLEDKIVTLIDVAYCLSPPRKAKNTMPRDILVDFADLRSRQHLLLEACTKGFLMHGTSKILVFPDLLVEMLEARCRLLPVTKLLSQHNHQY